MDNVSTMCKVFVKDDELLTLIKANDENAFKTLYDTYWEQLFISAYNILKNREVCEDIVQEIFIRFWANRESIQIKTSLKGYLHASVVYRVYDYFKKNKNVFKEEFFEAFDNRSQKSNPESQLIYTELCAQINFAVELVPKRSRIVYKLSREKQLSHKEISEKLNISTKTVEAHITKALKVIRSSMDLHNGFELILLLAIIEGMS